jgi:pyruvate,water dikinase
MRRGWSFRELAALRPHTGDDRDPLLEDSGPDVCWTRINTAEAAPGVLTPLAWSGFYRGPSEIAVMTGFADLGVMPRKAARGRGRDERLLGCFHGRLSINVSTLRSIMGGLPGTSGDDVEHDILGSSRAGVIDEDFGWRIPALAARMPRYFLTNTRELATLRGEIERWWHSRVGPEGARAGLDPVTVFEDALDWFCAAMHLHGRARLFFQGTQTQIAGLVGDDTDPTLSRRLLAGAGDMEETAVADGIWQIAHGQLTMTEFIDRYGFHGPDIGNVASRSWRENPAPIERLLDRYREIPEHARPARRATAALDGRIAAQHQVLGALGGTRRAAAKVLLRAAPRFVRDLERGKSSYLIALDAARGAARAYGRKLVDQHVLAEAGDIFYLTAEEILDPLPDDVKDLIAHRRERREAYRQIDCPETWIGMPEPRARQTEVSERPSSITGIGASTGTVEGLARVIADAADAEPIEDGEILVCPVTDPSWVSLMAISSALVIDIGGTASHGAIIARELGVPCVINTITGTRDLSTGDRIRVNGDTGAVEVLERARSEIHHS